MKFMLDNIFNKEQKYVCYTTILSLLKLSHTVVSNINNKMDLFKGQ